MVLSNKKTKEKLRSLLAESLATFGSAKPNAEVAQELRSLKEFLIIRRSQKPRPPRKKKEREKNGETPEKELEKDKGQDGGGEKEKKSKKKKRKREELEGITEGETAEKSGSNKKKKIKEKKKKMRKNRKERKKKKDSAEEKPKEELDASEREESGHAARKVYVGGIPYYSTEEDIKSFFESCGTVTEVDFLMFPDSGKFRGIAILTFKIDAAAKRALALDGADMGGFYLKIQPYKPPRVAPKKDKADFTPEIIDGYNRIYVGNLSWEITEDELRDFFSGCNISAIRFGEDKTTGEFKGYAHIDFSDKESLTTALKLDQEVVCGRPVRIRCAVPLKKSTGDRAVKTSETVAKSNVEIEAAEGASGPAKGKKKKRTCYNCGTPGHLSSDCPEKKSTGDHAVKISKTAAKSNVEIKATEGDSGPAKGKKKRRTCYNCGTPGHLSSDCPEKKDDATASK